VGPGCQQEEAAREGGGRDADGRGQAVSEREWRAELGRLGRGGGKGSAGVRGLVGPDSAQLREGGVSLFLFFF
jgi:hypothetical protein